MSRQISAHVTLIYPWEAPDSASIAHRVKAVAGQCRPFRLRVADLVLDGPGSGSGCGFRVDDVDGGYRRLRSSALTPPMMPGDVPPHVTVVHPRTSSRGPEAWDELGSIRLDIEFSAVEVAITAWDGDRWLTIESIPLG